MHIELVVFDMAGTTVQDDDAVNRCLRDALREQGVDVDRGAVDAVMGWTKPVAIRSLLRARRSDASPALVDLVHDRFRACMVDHYATAAEVREVRGTSEAFRALRRDGVKIALDTGFDRVIADVVLRRMGWLNAGLVDAVVTADEVARGRPFPDMVHEAMRRCGVRGSWSVAKVGDTPSDLLEGTAAGCSIIVGVTEGTHGADQLVAHPHTHLIGTVAELPAIIERLNASWRAHVA
jgi:phosphonatase-like hydrolase